MNETSNKLQEEVRKNKKRVRDRNRRFSKLSPANRRISIAKDVIKQLNVEKFTAQTGMYFRINVPLNIQNEDLSFEISKADSCNVCALGALFSSCVLKNNHFKLNENTYKYNDYYTNKTVTTLFKDDLTSYLKPYFSIMQLCMIEDSFECEHLNDVCSSKLSKKCISFGRKFPDAKDRMVAIMQNIIDNNGKFVP